jgi:calcium/calmodulin-dependent protein kinase kinase 2
VTRGGTDPLLAAEENCADLVDPPTEAEMDHAITGNMAHLLIVMKAVKRFKNLLYKKRPQDRPSSILGRDSRLVTPPHSIRGGSRSIDTHDRTPFDSVLVTSGVHRDIDIDDDLQRLPREVDRLAVRSPPEIDVDEGAAQKTGETDAHFKQRMESERHRPSPQPTNPAEHRELLSHSHTFPADDHAKGHAHNPLDDTLYLDIGADAEDPSGHGDADHPVVSESPPAVELNIYEQAYQDEMNRIMQQRGGAGPSIYLTRRVEHREDIRSHSSILDSSKDAAKNVVDNAAHKLSGLALAKDDPKKLGSGGLAGLVKQVHEAAASKKEEEEREQAIDSTKTEDEEDDPPLRAPKFDGTPEEKDEGTGELGQAAEAMKQHLDPNSAEALIKNQARLDAHKGAMPGMPGGFPVTPPQQQQAGKGD